MKLRIIFLLSILSLSSLTFAQSSGDRLYNQGIELQKKQTIQSQKSAIAKFQSAKKLYDSAAKKKQCDDAITVSNNIIQTISANKAARESLPKKKKEELKEPVLELSNENLLLTSESRSVTINITTTEEDWSVVPITNYDGESFISVNQNKEEKTFEIVCPENTSTRQRNQVVEVRAGELKRSVTVEQKGKPTMLNVEKTVVEFSSKGGSKSIEVYSNSDDSEDSNNNRNWKVVSKPEWVSVVGEEMKEKGFLGKLGDKAKSLVKKNSSSTDAPDVVTSIMKLVVASKSKKDPSRSGEIVIMSGDQQATIIIQQK